MKVQSMREVMLSREDFAAAVFIGGMEGVLAEHAMFTGFHPAANDKTLKEFIIGQSKLEDSTTTTLVKEPPSGDEWLHELKFDGYRMLCRIERGRVTVWSRNGKDWTEKFQNVVEAVKALKVTSAMLDGEIVIVDAQGRSSFQKLQRAMGKATVTGFAYEVFDLIYLNGLTYKYATDT